MNAIVTVDKNWGIGYSGRKLVNIPSDQKRLQELIEGKIIVLGRKTLESFPKQISDYSKLQIVITENNCYSAKNTVVVNSINALLEELKKYKSEDIYILGGESVFNSLIDKCDRVFVTLVDYKYTADAFFTNLDSDNNWKKTFEDEEAVYFDVTYNFAVYERD